jgi:heme/copper-type cytochrome/quinol oxidase subunit 3
MALFLAAEVMFFAGLISAFAVLRAQAPVWPPSGQPRLPVLATGLNTAVLLLSAWTMHRALAGRDRGERDLLRWLSATAMLGAVFLGVQGAEWVRMIQFGLTTSSSLYGATFYALVGAHGLHVLGALVALLAVRHGAARGRYQPGDSAALRPMAMYWMFVVAVWPLLYLLVYF